MGARALWESVLGEGEGPEGRAQESRRLAEQGINQHKAMRAALPGTLSGSPAAKGPDGGVAI